MKVNKVDFIHLMTGSTTFIPRLDSYSKVSSERILSWITPREVPGMGVLIFSHHTKEQIHQHLLAKWLTLGFLRKSERFFSQFLTVALSPAKAEIQKFILSNEFRKSADRKDFHRKLLGMFPSLTPKSPRAYLYLYEPEGFLRSVWVDKKRFPPKAFIGIGYTDQGTLSTIPAWQEQVTWSETEESLVDEVKILLSHFVTQPPFSGPTQVSRADEAIIGRNGFRWIFSKNKENNPDERKFS